MAIYRGAGGSGDATKDSSSQAAIVSDLVTQAITSANSASTSATNAATSYTSFHNQYQGAYSTAPTLRPDSSALQTGDLYFNTTNSSMKVRSSSSTWLDSYATLSGALVATNNLSDVTSASTSRTNLGVAIGSNVQAWDADLDAIAAIAGTSGLLKKTAANTWSLDTSTYLTSAVTSVTGTSPIVSSGGTTPAISIPAATTSVSGYLTSTDWNTFNGKQAAGSYVTVGGALGTPSSGTLTNCTFPTLNQNTTGSAGSVTNALTAGTGLTATATYNGSAAITFNATGTTINSQTSAYVLVASDAGKTISITTGGVTVNNSVMSAGNIVSIYNNSGSSQTITQGTGVTLQWAGQSSSSTGNRTLGLYGLCTIVFISASNAVITGSGLT